MWRRSWDDFSPVVLLRNGGDERVQRIFRLLSGRCVEHHPRRRRIERRRRRKTEETETGEFSRDTQKDKTRVCLEFLENGEFLKIFGRGHFFRFLPRTRNARHNTQHNNCITHMKQMSFNTQHQQQQQQQQLKVERAEPHVRAPQTSFFFLIFC